jgi:hypothetical protein
VIDDEITDSEMWREQKKRSQQKRASNRDRSTEMLVLAGIPFVSKNNGAHLIVDNRYDFWPGTGLWQARDEKRKHRGIRSLIARIKP